MGKQQLEKMTVVELKKMAKELGFKGYSRLCKAELVTLLETKPSTSQLVEVALPPMVEIAGGEEELAANIEITKEISDSAAEFVGNIRMNYGVLLSKTKEILGEVQKKGGVSDDDRKLIDEDINDLEIFLKRLEGYKPSIVFTLDENMNKHRIINEDGSYNELVGIRLTIEDEGERHINFASIIGLGDLDLVLSYKGFVISAETFGMEEFNAMLKKRGITNEAEFFSNVVVEQIIDGYAMGNLKEVLEQIDTEGTSDCTEVFTSIKEQMEKNGQMGAYENLTRKWVVSV